MKKGKGFFTGLVLTLLIAAIITGSLVAGYKFITYINRDAKKKFEEVAKNIEVTGKEKLGISLDDHFGIDESKLLGYEEKEKRNYQGPRLYECSSYIFNDRGEVLTDFFETNSYGLNVSFDADRKYGVLRKDGDCYLVDAELNYTKITSDCAYFGINFEGTHLFYCNANKVCIYDIENKKEILIDNSGFNACISPNGKVVSYIKYRSGGDVEVYIAGIDMEPKSIDITDKGFFDPIAVSDDGNSAFFEAVDTSEGDGLFCYDNGERYKICKNYTHSLYFDRNCQKALFYFDNKVRYFDVFTNAVVDLNIDGHISEMLAYGDYKCNIGGGYRTAILDSSNFENSIIIKTYDDVYTVDGIIPEAVLLSLGYTNNFGVSKEGPTCVFKRDDTIIKSVCKDGEVTETIFAEPVSYLSYGIMNDEFNEGYFIMREEVGDESTYNLYCYKEGKPREFVADCGDEGYDAICWDKFFKKCYYISGGKLYSRSDDTGEIKLIAESCSTFAYIYSEDKIPCFKDESSKEFVVINDTVYER
jgi:hypothetical protein